MVGDVSTEPLIQFGSSVPLFATNAVRATAYPSQHINTTQAFFSEQSAIKDRRLHVPTNDIDSMSTHAIWDFEYRRPARELECSCYRSQEVSPHRPSCESRRCHCFLPYPRPARGLGWSHYLLLGVFLHRPFCVGSDLLRAGHQQLPASERCRRSTEKAVAIRIFILELLGYGQFPPSVPDPSAIYNKCWYRSHDTL